VTKAMDKQKFRVVGQSITRIDAREKVTGSLTYGSDFNLPGQLVGKILRSPVPHARIVRIDTSAAEALTGVKAVITALDTPKIKFGFQSAPRPDLADKMMLEADKVRFIGDEVAAVAASTELIALEALQLIEVEYEELPAVFDPFEAMGEGSPVVHDETPDNVIDRFEYGTGDTQEAMVQADVVVEGTFYSSRVHPLALETHQAIADWDANGRLTMYASTQMPFLLRQHMAGVLGVDESDVRIIKMPMGGGFGGRMEMHPLDPIAAILAKKTGRPVKIIYSRTEEFIGSRFRHAIWMTARLGAMSDGTIVAFEIDMVTDSGAYVAQAAGVNRVGLVNAMTLYRVPNTSATSRIVYTNNPYASAYRGYGNPQANLAIESLVTELAEKLDMDELELRISNGNVPDSETYLGQIIDSCGYEECVRRGAEAIGWGEKRGKRHRSGSKVRGVGAATAINVGGGARDQGDSDSSGAIVIMQDDGSVSLNTGGQEIGSGGHTVLAQIIAEELGVTVDRVHVHASDTDMMPWDIGSHAQRSVFCAGNAVFQACQEAKSVLLGEIERRHEVAADDVELRDNNVHVKGTEDPLTTIGEVAHGTHFRSGGQLIWGKGFYDPPTVKTDERGRGHKSGAYSFGSQFAEVEVDLETGAIEVILMVGANDVGTAINPAGVEGQIEGGILQGVGQALSEEIVLDEGSILNPMLHAYGVPSAADSPPIRSLIVESATPEGPFGAKGVGEITVVPTCAAISNAIYDATGVRLTSLPFTPESLLKGLEDMETV
jgi:CO/xanthine dehydrogenase Mo-binding subunit